MRIVFGKCQAQSEMRNVKSSPCQQPTRRENLITAWNKRTTLKYSFFTHQRFHPQTSPTWRFHPRRVFLADQRWRQTWQQVIDIINIVKGRQGGSCVWTSGGLLKDHWMKEVITTEEGCSPQELHSLPSSGHQYIGKHRSARFLREGLKKKLWKSGQADRLGWPPSPQAVRKMWTKFDFDCRL